MKTGLKALCILLTILSSSFAAVAQTYAPGHAYLYKEPIPGGASYGLCTRARARLTAAKYNNIEQTNLFLIAQELTPFGEGPNQSRPLDLYSAQGKFIQTVSGISPINDSMMLTYTWNVEGKLVNYMFYDNAKFLKPGPEHKAPPGAGYPRAGIAYASGKTVDPGFELVSLKLPGDLFIISKNGRQGLYSPGRNKMLLTPLYDTVMYKPDSFFLGWNSEKDHKLIDVNGKEYKSPAVVYKAGKINDAATIFGVYAGIGTESRFYATYNNRGKLIAPLSMFETWMNYVTAFNNIEPKYYYRIPYTKWNNIKGYLLDTEAKPLLNPKDNPDSIIIHQNGYLFLIGRYTPPLARNETYGYRAVFNALDHKIIARAGEGAEIVAERDLLYVRKNDTNYYYDPYGNVIATTHNVVATERNKSWNSRLAIGSNAYQVPIERDMFHRYEIYTGTADAGMNKSKEPDSRFMLDGKAYIRGPEGGYTVPVDSGKEYIFEELEPLKTDTYYKDPKKECYYFGRVKGKWGIYRIEPLYKDGYHVFSNTAQQVTVIAAPAYEEIIVCKAGADFLFRVQDNGKKWWIDASGTVLAGGKDFNYIGFSSLPNGHRLAFELDAENTGRMFKGTPVVTKVMMIDATGNILKELKIKEKSKITPGEFYIADEDQVIAGNTVYNLGTGKKRTLINSADYSTSSITKINGRAIIATFYWQQTTKPGIFTKGGTSYNDVSYVIATGERLEGDRGWAAFFNDAVRKYGTVVSEDGTVYGGRE